MGKEVSPKPITKKKLLGTEGQDEVAFFEELFKHMGMENIVDLREVKGKDNFKNEIRLLKRVTGFSGLEAIAIIRDADKSFTNTFKSIIGVLKRCGLQTPKNPGEFSLGKPKVGVFIMPDNKSSGALETLCLETVKDAKEMECVNRFIDCANQLENPPKEKDIAKAKVQAFLAIMPEVPDRLGIGAKKGYWDFDSAELAPLKNFLSELKRMFRILLPVIFFKNPFLPSFPPFN
jgi:hypothetical protein